MKLISDDPSRNNTGLPVSIVIWLLTLTSVFKAFIWCDLGSRRKSIFLISWVTLVLFSSSSCDVMSPKLLSSGFLDFGSTTISLNSSQESKLWNKLHSSPELEFVYLIRAAHYCEMFLFITALAGIPHCRALYQVTFSECSAIVCMVSDLFGNLRFCCHCTSFWIDLYSVFCSLNFYSQLPLWFLVIF